MGWTCAAIDHGVAVFPNGKIGPCCQINSSYLKPIAELSNPDRFADLKTQDCPPDHPCNKCSVAEYHGLPSYRNTFDSIVTSDPGLQFVDIRNTNFCNLKCRYCGPHFSSQWAEELDKFPSIRRQDISNYKDTLITDSLHWMYFTGGEPLISGEHWELLEELIAGGRSGRISLMYNTNLTTIKYKDKIIQILTPGWFSSTKKLSIQEIEQIAKYLNILNTIYNDYTVSNRKDIYNYIIEELKKKPSLDKDLIVPFINKIKYKDDPTPNLNTDLYNKIKSELINVLTTLPAP